MKVLVANKYWFPNGGSERVMFDEIALLKQAGVTVVEFAMQDPRNAASRYSNYFVSPRNYHSGSLASRIKAALTFIHSHEAVANISCLIRAERPDILHCHNVYHQLTPSIITAASRLGVPVVLTLHDLKTVCPVYNQVRAGERCDECMIRGFEAVLRRRCAGQGLAQRCLLWAEARYHGLRATYDHVSRFIAPSRFVQQAVAQRFAGDKLIWIPNGVELPRLLDPPAEEAGVIYVGRLSPEKGVECLLMAHADDCGRWPLAVIGDGPALPQWRARYRLAEFTGRLAGQALDARIRSAAVVVVPSEVQENCPMSAVEAMAYAKPIVASRIGGIPELVRHGETGFLFEPQDRRAMSEYIRMLLANSDTRRRLGWAARRLVERRYTLEAHGRTLLELYSTLCTRIQTQAAQRSPLRPATASWQQPSALP